MIARDVVKFLCMLPKKYRLSAAQIEEVAKRGRYTRSNELWSIKFLVKNGVEKPMVAISVSKKIVRLATKRNAIRRKVRAAFTQLVDEGEVDSWGKGFYLIVVKDEAVASSAVAELAQQLKQIEQKHG